MRVHGFLVDEINVGEGVVQKMPFKMVFLEGVGHIRVLHMDQFGTTGVAAVKSGGGCQYRVRQGIQKRDDITITRAILANSSGHGNRSSGCLGAYICVPKAVICQGEQRRKERLVNRFRMYYSTKKKKQS